MRRGAFLALLVGGLVASLGIISVELLAQEQGKGASDSTVTTGLPTYGPGNEQEVEAFFDKLITSSSCS